MTAVKYLTAILFASKAWAQQYPEPVQRLQEDGLEVVESVQRQ